MITEHAICALPADHRDWRHVVIRVQRRSNSDMWVLNHGNYYLTADRDWSPSITDADCFNEVEALQLAQMQSVLVEVNGLTAADLLNR